MRANAPRPRDPIDDINREVKTIDLPANSRGNGISCTSPILSIDAIYRLYGGEGGIRTPDTLSGMPVFKTGAINRSATSPRSAGPLRLYVELRRFRACQRHKPPCASAGTKTKAGARGSRFGLQSGSAVVVAVSSFGAGWILLPPRR